MPNPACQSDDGNTAIFVGTFLETGSTATVCRDCLEAFSVALAQELTGVPVIQLVASYGPHELVEDVTGQITQEEIEQQAWLTDHRDAIEAVMAEGGTFDEAVATVLELEEQLTSIQDNSTPSDL